MGFVTATADRLTIRNFSETFRLFAALAASGFRRYSTYRQATVASLITNTMFGFLRSYVMLAVAGAGVVAGYSPDQLVAYVWAGQGLLGVVLLWGWSDLADRIRSGDIVMDLLRPVNPVLGYLAADLGRAGYAMLTRFTVPVLCGFLAFGSYLPQRIATYPIFALSVLLAVVICFACRYLVNAASYWLLDNRGVTVVWLVYSGIVGGLYFPIRFLPDWLVLIFWLGTPGPSLLQAPIDILVERDPVPIQWGMLAVQLFWAALMIWVCHLVQRRAERKLVVQGG